MQANVGKYFPKIYDGIYDTDIIIDAENALLDGFFEEVSNLADNQYILTANEEGIGLYEKLYKIVPNPATEDLAFRRARVLNRASLTLPFSMRFLENKLTEIMGEGNYTIEMDYGNYTIKVVSPATSANWYQEISILIGKVKPCNMVFVNKPYIDYSIVVDEEIGAVEVIYNYRLGTTWELGKTQLSYEIDLGVMKVAEISSIKGELLKSIASFAAEDIDNVIINDEYIVDEFNIKEAEENIAMVEYSLPEGCVLEVKNVKLRKGETVLAESNIFVPVTSQIDIRHKICVKEGA